MSVQIGTFKGGETSHAGRLGPFHGRYTPNYRIRIYKGGDPKRQVKKSELDLGSVTSVHTSKNVNQVVGSFQIVLKDARAMYVLHPMDVVEIALKGHNQPMGIVLRGLVSSVGPSGQADTEGGEESTVITGGCMGRYLQVNMFFLPVWSPESLLPTLLVYGMGGIYQHSVTPREVFRSVYRKYVVGVGNQVGISGTPAAKHWLNPLKRFEKITNGDGSVFRLPYIQFNEEPTEAALTRMEITGFSEAWVDEMGNVVYRRPAWDRPVRWVLPAEEIVDWELAESDEGLATYVEVVPTGNPGLTTATAEALLAGRAPIPSNYVASLKKEWKPSEGAHQQFIPEFIIDVYAKSGKGHVEGEVNRKGERNYYYRMMKKYGMRPLQIASPLLTTGRQAQEQAQGLLRFFLRRTKTATITIPGEPQVRMGENILLRGSLRGQRIERAFYIEGVSHEYVEEEDGGRYLTTLELAHGRDPHDAHFPPLQLDPISAAEEKQLARGAPPSTNEATGQKYATGSSEAKLSGHGKALIPGEAAEAVQMMVAAGNELVGKPYPHPDVHYGPLDEPWPAYDCSGAVSYILWKGGFLPDGRARDSGELADMFQAGVGHEVTVYANAVHTFIVVAGVLFNTWNPQGGETRLAWYPALASSITAIQASVGTMTARHPRGY